MKVFQTKEERKSGMCKPIDKVSTNEFTLVVREIERDYWLAIIIKHSNLFSDSPYTVEDSISNMTIKSSMFTEPDNEIFQDLLTQYYEILFMFHGPVTKLFLTNPDQIEYILDDFTKYFEKLYFKKDCVPTFFNSVVFRGFNIIPLSEKMYLYACKHINQFKEDFLCVDKVVCFFQNHYLYSDIAQSEVEKLYSYFIGAPDCHEEGFIDEWEPKLKMKYLKSIGGLQKVSVKGRRKDSGEEEDILVGEMDFMDIDYEDFAAKDDNSSAFGKSTTSNESFKLRFGSFKKLFEVKIKGEIPSYS